jgi:uncharacterized membrane protein
MTEPQRWTDEKVDALIGLILQTGVVLSGLLVLVGGALYLLRYGMAPSNYRHFGAEPSEIRHISPILNGVARLDGRSIIELGILVLVATPVIRVMFSVFAFAVRRDRLYVPITLVVLAILLYGLFGGAH